MAGFLNNPEPEAPEPPVLVFPCGGGIRLHLNRPKALNSLNLEMVRLLQGRLSAALENPQAGFVLLTGEGRAFCAGGDVLALCRAALEKDVAAIDRFFREEYALDLALHRFPKPVIVFAHGAAMGGGLGLAAGADIVVSEPGTVMAMPETRIGFHPDVGATHWLHTRLLPGYPEYLALCGCEVTGAECARVGFATCHTDQGGMEAALEAVLRFRPEPGEGRAGAALRLKKHLAPCARAVRTGPEEEERDAWVKETFSGAACLAEILRKLGKDGRDMAQAALGKIAARSPTAQTLALLLLRHNRERPLEEVFDVERKAALFMTAHPDYAEGVRAQVIEKDYAPGWSPARAGEVELPPELLRVLRERGPGASKGTERKAGSHGRANGMAG
jgi:enoyl-CoA hydratase/carnithine racemase